MLLQKLIAAENARKEHQASLAAVSEQLAREKDASAGLEAALDRTRVELVHARDSICLTQDETIRKDQTLESLLQSQRDSHKEVSDMRSRNKKTEEELAKVTEQCAKHERLVAEQSQQIMEMKGGYNDLVATLEDREREIEYLKQVADDAEVRCETAEATISELLAERDQVRFL